MLKILCRLSNFLTELSFLANFLMCQVPKTSCHIIHTVRDLSDKNYHVFIVNENKRTSLTMFFGYRKLKTKKPKKGIRPYDREEKKPEQTVSADLGEEQIVVAESSIFDVNQYIKYENDKEQLFFDCAFAVRYTVGVVFQINILGVEKVASF